MKLFPMVFSSYNDFGQIMKAENMDANKREKLFGTRSCIHTAYMTLLKQPQNFTYLWNPLNQIDRFQTRGVIKLSQSAYPLLAHNCIRTGHYAVWDMAHHEPMQLVTRACNSHRVSPYSFTHNFFNSMRLQ